MGTYHTGAVHNYCELNCNEAFISPTQQKPKQSFPEYNNFGAPIIAREFIIHIIRVFPKERSLTPNLSIIYICVSLKS